jgi:hypothetical protein
MDEILKQIQAAIAAIDAAKQACDKWRARGPGPTTALTDAAPEHLKRAIYELTNCEMPLAIAETLVRRSFR